jgi:predicted MPP superfamily phosphohydrolase
MRFDAGWLKVERLHLNSHPDALKVVHFSDLHIGYLFVKAERIRKVISRENPDIVLITGDFIEKEKEMDKLKRYLKALKLPSRTYACLGNHDYEAFLHNKKNSNNKNKHEVLENNKGLPKIKELLALSGITLLENENRILVKNNRTINLIGISDIRYNLQDAGKAFKGIDQYSESTNIVITHSPDMVLSLESRQRADYMFAGHFHGGQIWAPFGLEFKLLRKDIHCKKGISRGLHKIGNTSLYISRGLGCVSLPLRFLSRPEVTVVKL